MDLSLVTSVGGFGGFLASVRAIGVVQPPGINVSADDTVRGGAEGNFFALGGGTKPASVDPSPSAANTVPEHRVAVSKELNPIIFRLFMVFFLSMTRVYGAFQLNQTVFITLMYGKPGLVTDFLK